MASPKKPNPPGKILLGTFSGVFVPSFLTIMGVIVFLRMGLVMGYAGVIQGLFIILLANTISVLTSLSVSAIATNTKVKGGGVYYLISRSLGLEYGGPIGLVLFLSQAVSVAFYIIGFSEILFSALPFLAPYAKIIQITFCIIIYICAMAELDWAAKVQTYILLVLCLGLISFLVGAMHRFTGTAFEANLASSFDAKYSFWVIFAIFFPAITGFTQGISLSGDLKEPEKSIPKGTLYAVIISLVVYVTFGILVTGSASRESLIQDLMVMKKISLVPILISLGVVAATLSSALTSFLGAPRILQALAADHVFPFLKYFAKGYGPSNTPRAATTITFIVAVLCILEGDLNTIAPVVTMFFLITYGLMNYATFVEGFGNNPSFRPRFRFFHWRLSLAGAVGCLFVMLFIHALAAIVSILLVFFIYWMVSRNIRETSWGHARRGFYFSKIKEYLMRLRSEPFTAKNWRPQMLVLTGKPTHRMSLVRIAQWLEAGKGVVTLSHIIPGTIETHGEQRKQELTETRNFILENRLSVFWEVIVSPTYISGVESMIQVHSIGQLKPNTILMGWSDQTDKQEKFINVIQAIRRLGKNIVILEEGEALVDPSGEKNESIKKMVIDVWWRGEKNGSLMLLLAYLWTQNPECRDSQIRLLRIAANDEERIKSEKELKELISEARIEAQVKVVIGEGAWTKTVPKYSKNSSAVFIGLSIPGDGGEQTFLNTYKPVVAELGTTILVHCEEKIDVKV